MMWFVQSKKVMVLGIVSVALFSVGALFMYYNQPSSPQSAASLPSDRQQLYGIHQKLDSISDELNNRIETIAELGGEVEALRGIKQQIEAEKYQLKLTKNMDSIRYAAIQHKVVHYEKLLSKNDIEIGLLKETIAQLKTENQNIKDQKDSLMNEVKSLYKQKTLLEEKIQHAKLLKIDHFFIQAIDKKQHEHSEKDFFAKEIARLKIVFQIKENLLADISTKQIYLRLIEPNQGILFDQRSPTHRFTCSGKEQFCTIMKEIYYNTDAQTIEYIFEKGNPFQKGKHTLEVFCEGQLIGKHDFTIK